ncbi:PREDICTED: carotenoid cleavage dioxygenase 8, chloroplastic [Tarenaya hassleriana]|uniref:carotenoid cleavage dioxygenase 8, chloroplastic n=1 Tax=Tarenaya hassleriana TaxID=28532 RepID=UPI0008FD5A89|nr:PREDICTED: carotenoid cleavage dioxygenase 8, chloroplastic [Tarenaya hassleriana]
MAPLITFKAMMMGHNNIMSSNLMPLCSNKSGHRTKPEINCPLFGENPRLYLISGAKAATIPPSPAVAPSPEKENTSGVPRRCHGAWTSIQQEYWEGELDVQGHIPTWLKGTYLRNGPGLWQIGDYNFRHLFDGYSTVVKLQFSGDGCQKIIAGHRVLESAAYSAAIKHNRLCFREFSETPKTQNPFSHIGEFFRLFSGDSLTDNANTGVIRLGDNRVVCLTETQKGSILIDPETLKAIGRFNYNDDLNDFLIQSAHPIVTGSEFWTLIPDLVKPGYRVVRMEAGSNRREVVGRADCRGRFGKGPGWVHSFAVTENFVVIPEMPLRYSVRNLLRAEPTPFYKFEWCPESGAYLHVMSKHTGEIVASVEVPLYVTFHFINAYEERDEEGKVKGIVADCCEHNANTRILDLLRLHTLRSYHGHDILPQARIGRFKIPLDGSIYGELETAIQPEEHGSGMDMCSINPLHLGRKYRYVYACGAKRPCNFPNALTKVDLVEKKAKNWHEHGIIPSEPFFVPRPGATREDDGNILTSSLLNAFHINK